MQPPERAQQPRPFEGAVADRRCVPVGVGHGVERSVHLRVGGTLKGQRASGTFQFTLRGTDVTCDSGLRSWTARWRGR